MSPVKAGNVATLWPDGVCWNAVLPQLPEPDVSIWLYSPVVVVDANAATEIRSTLLLYWLLPRTPLAWVCIPEPACALNPTNE